MRASDEAMLSQLLSGRVRGLNEAAAQERAPFVLLWLQGQRRLGQNLAVSHAQRAANELGKPLLVYEGLRHDYPHASDRFHRFVLEGAADNARECERRGMAYGFFLQRPDSPRGVLHQLAARAALVVTDWLPTFIHPAQTRALADRAPCRVEAVDAAGVMPLSISPHAEIGARTLRPKVHRALAGRLLRIPEPSPGVKPPARFDWGFEPLELTGPRAQRAGQPEPKLDEQLDGLLAGLPIDHAVRPSAEFRGGTRAAQARLARFLERLPGYAEERNQPSADRVSGLSPYLHFGHLGAGEIALAAREAGAPEADLAAFLEELIVRRELAYNFCARTPAHQGTSSLPGWAQATLRKHEEDPRPALPTDAQLEAAQSPDELWNAAQRQLVQEGRIHGYLRMLWGKLLLLWSRDAEEAHRRMVFLNDKYALDGRDANGYSNFLWCLGLHDRPFPERAIFGTVRSMTSASTQRKFDLGPYLARWSALGA